MPSKVFHDYCMLLVKSVQFPYCASQMDSCYGFCDFPCGICFSFCTVLSLTAVPSYTVTAAFMLCLCCYDCPVVHWWVLWVCLCMAFVYNF